jgi:hypothetical protein
VVEEETEGGWESGVFSSFFFSYETMEREEGCEPGSVCVCERERGEREREGERRDGFVVLSPSFHSPFLSALSL